MRGLNFDDNGGGGSSDDDDDDSNYHPYLRELAPNHNATTASIQNYETIPI